MSLSRQKFFMQDFSGQDLSGQDLSYSTFTCCKFDGTDLSRANCSHSDFVGSSMRRTKCTGTDFAHSCLAVNFEPVDAYGMTMTFHCNTFDQMRISRTWWYAFLYFALLMKPVGETEELHKGLTNLIGEDRTVRLKKLFIRRVM